MVKLVLEHNNTYASTGLEDEKTVLMHAARCGDAELTWWLQMITIMGILC